MRFELEVQGVRVQPVCPGEFDSPMVDAPDRTSTPENRQHTLTIPKLGVKQSAPRRWQASTWAHKPLSEGRWLAAALAVRW
jgi:3-dehydrosphinganine reductase